MNKGFIESFCHNGSAIFEGGICIPNNKKEGSHYAKIAAMNGLQRSHVALCNIIKELHRS